MQDIKRSGAIYSAFFITHNQVTQGNWGTMETQLTQAFDILFLNHFIHLFLLEIGKFIIWIASFSIRSVADPTDGSNICRFHRKFANGLVRSLIVSTEQLVSKLEGEMVDHPFVGDVPINSSGQHDLSQS